MPVPMMSHGQLLRRFCEAGLKRLRTDQFDLNLLHWCGAVPPGETVEALERLVEASLIARWGPQSGYGDMEGLMAAGRHACATNQILCSLARRAPEPYLLLWLADRSMPVMAYSEQGCLISHKALAEVARSHEANPTRIALA